MDEEFISQLSTQRQWFQDNFFTTRQAAELLCKHPKTLEGWRLNKTPGAPPYYKTANNRVFYKISELKEWLLRDPVMVELYAAEDAVHKAKKSMEMRKELLKEST
jgi:hypothetical protein